MQVHFPEIPKSRDVAYDVFIYIKAFCEIVWWNRSMCTPRGVEVPCVLLGGWRRRNGGGGRGGRERRMRRRRKRTREVGEGMGKVSTLFLSTANY